MTLVEKALEIKSVCDCRTDCIDYDEERKQCKYFDECIGTFGAATPSDLSVDDVKGMFEVYE